MNHSEKLSPGLNKWLVSWSKQSKCKFRCVAFCYFLLTRAVLFPRVGDLCLRVTVVSWCRGWRGLATALMGRWGMRCYVSGEDQAAVIMLLPGLRGASRHIIAIVRDYLLEDGGMLNCQESKRQNCVNCQLVIFTMQWLWMFYLILGKPQTVLINRK